MKKKIIKIIIILASLLLIYLCVYFIQSYMLGKSLENKWLSSESTKFIDHDIVRCDYNILKPEIALVDEAIVLEEFDEMEIFFYKPEKFLSQTKEEWESNYAGSVDIKNTTFPELLSMVKDDCSQFQKSGRAGDVEWIYSKPRVYKEKTEEQKKAEFDAEMIRQEIEHQRIIESGKYTEEELREKENPSGIILLDKNGNPIENQ